VKGYEILQIIEAPRWPPGFVFAAKGKTPGTAVLRFEPAACFALVEKGSLKVREIIPFFVDLDGKLKCALDEDVLLILVRIDPHGTTSFDNEADLATAKKLLAKLDSIEAEVSGAKTVESPKLTMPKVETVGDRPNAKFFISDQWGQKHFEGTFAEFTEFTFITFPPTMPLTEAHDRIDKFVRERGFTVKWT